MSYNSGSNRARNLKSLARLLPELYSTQSYYHYITYMKKFEKVKQKKRTRITQSGKNCVIKLRHSRRAMDLKAKDLIGSFKNRIVY